MKHFTISTLVVFLFSFMSFFSVKLQGQDTAPPFIISFSPADNSAEFPIDQEIAITFNEPIFLDGDIAILSDKNSFGRILRLNDPDLQVIGNQILLNLDNKIMDPNANYRIIINATSIRDVAGNFFAGLFDDQEYNFSTTTTIDALQPSAILNPTHESTGISLDQIFTVTLDEKVVQNGNIIPSLSIVGANGFIPINRILTDDGNGSLLSIVPQSNLLPNTTYKIYIDDGNYEDLSGNDYRGTTTFGGSEGAGWYFTTVNDPQADVTPPTAVFSPASGSNFVSVNQVFTIEFNELVQSTNDDLFVSIFEPSLGGGFSTIADMSIANGGLTLTDDGTVSTLSISPLQPLPANKNLYLNINVGHFTDIAGNSWAGSNAFGPISEVWKFTTELGDTPCVSGDLDLEITFDSFAEETSWRVINADGSEQPASGSYTSTESNTTVIEQITGLTDGTYQFIIEDTFGDGICCAEGLGSYNVSKNGIKLFEGGSFGTSQSFVFCIDSSIDSELPIITCPEPISVNAGTACSTSVLITNPTVSDNVSNTFIFEGIRSDGLPMSEPFFVGENTITWSATDEAGNVSETCEQIISITGGGDCWINIGPDIVGSSGNNLGAGVTINAAGNIAAFVNPNVNGSGNVGIVTVLEKVGDTWNLMGNSVPGGLNGRGSSGIDLNDAGNRLAVSQEEGKVKVYQFNGGTWQLMGSEIPSAGGATWQKVDFNASGNRLVVGYSGGDSTTRIGTVVVYDFQGGVWAQIGQQLLGSQTDDSFGRDVSLNAAGNRLAVGAYQAGGFGPGNVGESGYVRVFDFQGDNWSQIGDDLEGDNARDFFGVSVGLNDEGNRMVVGANAGSYAKAFQYENGVWSQMGTNFSVFPLEQPGYQVDINGAGNLVLIGNFNQPGRIYEWANNNWQQVGQPIYAGVGQDVAINKVGDVIIMGTPDFNENSGKAAIFEFSGDLQEEITETEITKNELNRFFVTDVNGGTSDDNFTLSTNGSNLRIVSSNTISSNETEVVQIDANTVEIPLGFINNSIFFEGGEGTNTVFLSDNMSMPNQSIVFSQFNITAAENGNLEFRSINGIDRGFLDLNGATIISPIDMNFSQSSLIGNGTIEGVVNFLGSSIISPGDSPGTIGTGKLTLQDNSIYDLEVNGTQPGIEHDQIVVTGIVSLNNTNLNLIGGYVNGANDEVILISNDGTDAVSGTFNDLLEGGTVSFGEFSGIISYVGGDGNDVVLTNSITDTTPPFLTSSIPESGALNILIDTDITMTFSEPIKVVAGESVTITEEATGTIHETFAITDPRVSVDGVTAIFDLVSDLSAGTEYRISLTEGAFADLADNLYEVASTWFFTTAAAIDNTPPTLVITNPTNEAIDVALDPVLSVTFSEPVQWATEGRIVIQDLTENITFGTLTENSAAVNFNGNVMEINPVPPFIAGHEYEIQIMSASLEDINGKPFAGIPSTGWTFTTLTGLVDMDGDGFFSDVDCDDNKPAINPEANEICDGLDNNCDGLIDDNDPEVECEAMQGTVDLIDATYLMGTSNPSPTGSILRVEEGNREIYLKFDLSNFSGVVTEAELQMTVASDPGNGTLEVFLGSNSNWTETGLNGSNNPSTVGVALASIKGTHDLGQLRTWKLNSGQLSSGGEITLIVKHSNGNDVAFASDETGQGPKLIITTGSGDLVDMDGDGFFNNVDCDDNNPAVNPLAIEVCDGIDNNCDGLVDDDDTSITCGEMKGPANLVDATYLMGSSNPSPNGPILRAEEGNREIYLKFDLSSFSGLVTKAELEMQVASDPGNGTLEVYLGSNSNWTETGLTGSNKPTAVGNAIASISDTYSLGQTKTWNLDVNQLANGSEVTLIVKHSNGNDVAFASDETNQAPRLIITSGDLVDVDGDGYFSDIDCDDTNFDINPDALEICDGIDNNCNGLIDDVDATITCDAPIEGTADLIDATYLEGTRNPSPNGPILRAEQGNREVYLKFDLSDFGTSISKVQLEMQVASDPGNGTLEVFLGSNSNWTESSLNGSNKPTFIGNAIGSISGTHSLGQTKIWNLNVSQLSGEGLITLIVKHSNGNDVAFASDETNQAPKLIITSGGVGAEEANSLNLSPNPASVDIAIGFEQPTQMGAIFVYDVSGKLVHAVPAGELKSEENYQMNVSSLPSGMYFVRTFDADGIPHQKAMLVEH
ncbi:MAG: Ig-like domain-containing protein [Maribacter sp.]